VSSADLLISRRGHLGDARSGGVEEVLEERAEGGERGGEDPNVEFDGVPDEVGVVAGSVRGGVEVGLEDGFYDGGGAGAEGGVSCGSKREKGETYNSPRDRMKTKDTLVRMLTWRFQTIGMGRVAKRTSVRMLIAGMG
jgi:hypothetical protein